MDHSDFHYKTLLDSDLPNQVLSVLAYQMPLERGLQAVMWSDRRKAWIYAPAIVTAYLYDPEYQGLTKVISRHRAEQVAREVLKTELPTEVVLQEMCEEGDRMDWIIGPPQE